MHYTTRQSLCRLGFLTACVLPTALVGIWIVWPKSTAQWETRLSHQIGLNVEVNEVVYPRPNVTRLLDVRLRDPEMGEVAQAPRIEVTHTRHGLFVEIPRANLRRSQLHRIQEVLDQRILRQRTVGRTSLSIRAQAVSFTDTSSAEVPLPGFADLQCRLARTQQGARMTLSLLTPDENRQGPVEIVVERLSRDGGQPKTRWFLETNGPLPCGLLRGQIAAVAALGSRCHFDGLVWAERNGETWSADAEGRLTQLDLDQLVSQRFPHTLRGMATIECKRVQVRDSRLVAAAGTVHSLGGQVSGTLLEAAAHHLQLRRPAVPTLPLITFRQLHAGFLVEVGSLSVRGHCDSQGTMLTDGSGQPLLVESSRPTVGIWALVRTLVPASEVHVPFTQETTALLSMFPLPAAADIR